MKACPVHDLWPLDFLRYLPMRSVKYCWATVNFKADNIPNATQGTLKVVLENVTWDAVTYTEHVKRKTVAARGMVRALGHQSHTEPHSACVVKRCFSSYRHFQYTAPKEDYSSSDTSSGHSPSLQLPRQFVPPAAMNTNPYLLPRSHKKASRTHTIMRTILFPHCCQVQRLPQTTPLDSRSTESVDINRKRALIYHDT